MRRGISVVAMAAAIVLGATACGGGSGGTQDSGKAKDPAQVSGTVTYWDTSDAKVEAPAYKALIAAFEAKYPKIKVNYQNVDFTTVETKFKTAAQSGKGAPDVIRTDVGLIPEYASLHYIAPLDGTAALTDTSDFVAGPLNTTKYDGKSYAVPSVTDTLGLLYNKKIFAQAGITAAPTSWDEMVADAAKIKAKTGVTGTYMNPDSYFLLPFLFGEGADLADPAAKKVTVNSPEAVKAVTEAKKIYDTSSLKIDFANAYDNMQTSFKTGKVAMLIQGPWSVGDDLTGSAFKGANSGNLGYAPVPAGSTGKPLAPTGGQDLAVYQGSKNLSAAYLFTQFMTSTASQEQIAVKNGTLPTRTSAYSAAVLKSPQIAGFKPILDTARPRVALPQVGSLFTPLQQDYIKILQGKATVQGGLDDAAKQFGKLLPDYAVQ
ncbi:carbohydrate ABC transporter substrate-binding protein, CUT1 family [Actinacidiphila yanglinensis]|uniref:Carbohydrate ABC transporter substrate-binding protein, CUT1 family n=1 Tax=Actinacidiphila yanglinensis TaxID=310779 RepID=A0A1H5T6C8_9ACTN|nr:extracellular solute-binding protein [Actinacidiphila yanglinensis]SEF58346.1 carbohydrate ABC transporter substrate-binding protein, CUT1 family [Actinacidiphila yanglinensis]